MEHSTFQTSGSLRNLYFVRTVVQLAWAGLVFGSLDRPALTAILLVAYPLWDVACTLYDLKISGDTTGPKTNRLANVAFGLLTALAIALTISAHPAYAIAAFGVWALVAGALQLVTGLARRRQLGGQWAMILSGAQSSIAGISFVLGGLSGKLHPKDLAGYAIFGAVYFCIAGTLLARRLTTQSA
jgi:hypothetical protein